VYACLDHTPVTDRVEHWEPIRPFNCHPEYGAIDRRRIASTLALVRRKRKQLVYHGTGVGLVGNVLGTRLAASDSFLNRRSRR
jgi:hypothetical protein